MNWKRNIPDPIRGLTLERLNQQIDAYKQGLLASFAITAEAMEERDDILKNVITKRKKAVTRHGWEILSDDCSEEAQEHCRALEFFYKNLTCSHALRPDERGGFQLLVYQMMDAVGKGYAVHEVVWKPALAASRTDSAEKGFSAGVTAEFRFVPLWYFEASTGPLRFLADPYQRTGTKMTDGDWLVTVGDALMIACSRAFLFKHYPLQAWLDFAQKFGMPGVRGTTPAARGTAEFSEMEDSLRTFMDELSVVTSTAEAIDVIDLKGTGQPPFAELVERMDRVMAALWRGADLSTLSRDKGYGATLQEQEARVLELDDARRLSEHFNATVDRWVLEQFYGRGVRPLARLRILVTPRECTPHDLAIDEFLLAHGARLSLSDMLERYGRTQAQTGEPYLEKSGNQKERATEKSRLESVNALDSRFKRQGAGSNLLNKADARKSMKIKLQNSTMNTTQQEQSSSSPLDDYIQISPIGLFPHSKGFQNVDRTALDTLAKNFRSFFGRLGRRFAGIPFYVGHPDVPGFENQYQDRKAYGWIKDLEVREDGLYGKTTWSLAGRELIANGHFKFLSPYWEAIRIGSRDGRSVYSPTVLKSVGLTNDPNLPVFPLANDRDLETPGEADSGAFLGVAVGLVTQTNDSDGFENSQTGATEIPNGGSAMDEQRQTEGLVEVAESPTNPPPYDAQSGIEECRKQIELLNQRLIQTILDNAIANARILPIERPHWKQALANSFEVAAAELANTGPKLKTQSQTKDLPNVKPGETGEQKQKRIISLVHEKMRAQAISYHQAWVLITSEHPELF